MPVNLQKGGKISLTKAEPKLVEIVVGLGWNPRRVGNEKFDLDASCLLLGDNDRVLSDDGFIFYNNLKSACGSVTHMGDSRTGEAEGDDEQIVVNFQKVPQNVRKIAFVVTIDKADERRQNFGMVGGAYIRVVNKGTGGEIARFDLSEEASTSNVMLFGEVYRYNDEWKFGAVGEGSTEGLMGVCRRFGVNV